MKQLVAAASVAIAVLFATPAFADRPPTADELTKIEAQLRSLGFKSWGKIELDDKKWEIDDAIDQTGQKFDVDLDPTSLAVLKKERD